MIWHVSNSASVFRFEVASFIRNSCGRLHPISSYDDRDIHLAPSSHLSAAFSVPTSPLSFGPHFTLPTNLTAPELLERAHSTYRLFIRRASIADFLSAIGVNRTETRARTLALNRMRLFMVDLGWTGNPTTTMSSDGSYARFYDSLGESPSHTSLLAHTLFSRQNLPACASACFASANLGGCSATDDACLCKNGGFVSSAAACIEQTCTGSDLTAGKTACVQLCLPFRVTSLSTVLTVSSTTTGASSPATTSVVSSSSTPASSSSAPASSSGGSGTLATSESPNGRSKVMIGPIVGGVVGFLALVAFVVMGLIWFYKTRRRRIWVRMFPSDFSLTSAEHPLVVPSFPVEPFPIPSAASQNPGRLQRSDKPTSSGELPASPSMREVEATQSLIPTTTQTPSPMQMSSSPAGTPVGGLYSHVMVGSRSRMVLHQDSGIRLPTQAGEDEVVVEMPPLYSRS